MTVNLAVFYHPQGFVGPQTFHTSVSDGINLIPAPCRNADDFRRWLGDLSERVDGMLFTDELLFRDLQEQNVLLPVPYERVYPSQADLLHSLMRQAGGVYYGNLSRVMIDIGPSAEVLNEILPTQLRPMIVERSIWRKTPDETLAQSLLRRYRTAWSSSSFDLIIIDQFELLEMMRAEGMNTWCLMPGPEAIRCAAQKLALTIALSREGSRCPVFAVVGLRSGKLSLDALRDPIESYNSTHGRPFLVARRGSVLELSAFGLPREDLLSGRIALAFSTLLRQSLGESAVVGWGIGISVPHARDCAARAFHESMFDIDGGSYLVDEKNDIYGPFRQGVPTTKRPDNRDYLRALASKAGISITSMAHLLEATERIDRTDVTSEELAHSLGITQRSASRLLANLVAHGVAELCPYGGDSVRGRPARRYRLLL
jgi:hypothetical protein